MIINIDAKTYKDLIEWMHQMGKPYVQQGKFDLHTLTGGIQLMKQQFTKDDGFVEIYTFKLPVPKVNDSISYIDLYQEWAKWAHSVDATREPLPEEAIKLH